MCWTKKEDIGVQLPSKAKIDHRVQNKILRVYNNINILGYDAFKSIADGPFRKLTTDEEIELTRRAY